MEYVSRSSGIQWRYREISIDPTLVNNFAIEDQLYDTVRHSEAILDLVEELNEKIKEIIDTKLTPRQKQVMNMIYFGQMTQTEVAKELGLCQPTIHKLIAGNIDYFHNKKRYGGAIKKIQKLCDKSPDIIRILAEIDMLKQEML